MRSIGIPVADREECGLALQAAFDLGKVLKSDVVGYHMRPAPQAAPANIDLAGIWAGAGGWPEEDLEVSRAAAQRAEQLFSRSAQQHGYTLSHRHGSASAPIALFQENEGTPDTLFTRVGPVNDLLVVSRPSKKGGTKSFVVMMSALMDSATPVLVMPQHAASFRMTRLAIAWNGGRPEALLVRAALTLLQAADDVVFITEGQDHKPGPTASEMMHYLMAHGVESRQVTVQGRDTGRTLVESAQQEGSDVLLCGAYSRGRMREMVFGGVTEHLLTKTDFPVIMMHI